jgi:asparagine synthase (glutamine-hydrolysing)
MCGIVGYTGTEIPGKLIEMNTKVAHRGPDDEGFYNDSHYHLAMKRLAIVDVEHGQQPITSANNKIVALFNGEIYNYKELRKYLELDFDVIFDSDSDVEVILKLYEVLGIRFVHRIEGMFAICILDKRIDTLFLIRDRYGKKPIYYHHNEQDNSIEFASEFNALTLDKNEIFLHAEALNWYFSNKTTLTSFSIDQRVKKVKPGCYISIKQKKKIEETKYYSLKTGKTKQKLDETEVVNNINSKLIASVEKRLIGEVEIGAFLSGGLDSSLIVAILSKIRNLPIRTYSLIYNEKINEKENDRKFANLVSKSFNTRHQEILLTPDLLSKDLKKIVKAYGEPNSSVLSNWFVSKEMGKNIKVALSGDGADELFGSYKTHRLARFQDEVLSKDCKLNEFRDYGLSEDDINFKNTFFEIINSNFIFNQSELKLLLGHKYFKSNFLEEEVSRNLPIRNLSKLDSILHFDFKTLLPNQILSYIDTLGMAHSVEIRCPYLDNSLVNFILRIDDSYKINNRETKYVLKKVAERYLPKDLIYRKKEGFVEPSVYWIYKELKDFTLHYIFNRNFNQIGIINSDYALSLVKSFYEEDFNFNSAKKVWSILIFAIWESIYCDK